MCGGEGTRLRPLTFERPKPDPNRHKPSIEHLVSHLSNLGFHDIIITVGYKSDAIEQVPGDGALFGANISYVYEETKAERREREKCPAPAWRKAIPGRWR